MRRAISGIRSVSRPVVRRYQSSKVDYTGSISKGADRRMFTLLNETANVTLARCKGTQKSKSWALSITQSRVEAVQGHKG